MKFYNESRFDFSHDTPCLLSAVYDNQHIMRRSL